MSPNDPVTKFLDADHRRWIFPLRTPVVLAQTDAVALRNHIRDKILAKNEPDGFVTGQVAYSRKDQHHLRRVLVLDPFAMFFLYDFVQDNLASFPKPPRSDRYVFGHGFRRGKPVDPFEEYHAFRRKKYELIARFGHFAQVDVFNCFNSFYHHDLVEFVARKTSDEKGEQLGQFLRELNAGVSVACFPQGLYPAKAIGNAYLSLVERSRKLKAPGVARFLDDIVLAAHTRSEVEDHVLDVQCVLDEHHLSLNDSKTIVGKKGARFQEKKLDRIKRALLRKREAAKTDYDASQVDGDPGPHLSEGERRYLADLIREPNVAQEDIELALTLLRGEPDALDLVVEPVIDRAPHLLRGLHRFVGVAQGADHGHLWEAVTTTLRSTKSHPEHDLFWYARILIDYYDFDQEVADMLVRIYEHPKASPVVKAAILETKYLDHGFDDLKTSALRGEGTLLVASSAMVGLSRVRKAKRNHLYKYAARQGAHAAVLMSIAGKMPDA